MTDVVTALVATLVFFAIAGTWSRRVILRDRAENDAWWRDYRDRELLSYLQLGWQLGLRRLDGEDEDEAAYAARVREALLGVVREKAS